MAETNQLKEIVTYTFKYGSGDDSIDLNTLLLSQIHFSTMLNEIKNDLAIDSNLSIKVRPLTKGSVPFDIILQVSWVDHYLYPASAVLGIAGAIFGAFLGVIQLRKWSKGKKFTEVIFRGDTVIVKIGDREFEVNRISYEQSTKNPVIDKALQKAIEAVQKDENVTDIELLDPDKKPLIIVERADFENFTEPNELFEDATIVEVSEQSMVVNKLAFEKGYKWQFYVNGRKISATMNDDNFMQNINAGEKFAKGDVLIAELEVEKVYDKSVDTYIEKDFKITKVLKHIPRNEQSQIDFPIEDL